MFQSDRVKLDRTGEGSSESIRVRCDLAEELESVFVSGISFSTRICLLRERIECMIHLRDMVCTACE